MPPLNDEQLQTIRNERKTQIMEAALKVFANNGIKLTKISMIAKEAGVSHGLLYHYFNSKEEVLHESLESAMLQSPELFNYIDNMSASPLEKIKAFTSAAFTEGNSDIFRVVQHIVQAEDVLEKTKKLVENSSEKYIEHFFPLFVQGQESGEIIEGDPMELLELYLTVISGAMSDDLTWWNHDTDRKVDLLLRMITIR